jgi:predicted esterase
MNPQNANRTLLAPAMAAIAMLLSQPLRAEVIEKTKEVGGTTVHYKTVLPDGYDPAKAYPAILAMGGGPQTMTTIDSVFSRFFRAEAEKRGYIVIGPAAPEGQLFFQDGANIFPEFLDQMAKDYKIRDNKFHIAGVSNGGIAALHVAALHPRYFLSATSLPGYMWRPSAAKLDAISNMCVYMFAGEHDPYMWNGEMKREVAYLAAKGAVARVSEEQGQPHRLDSLAGDNAVRLFQGFEETGKGCNR